MFLISLVSLDAREKYNFNSDWRLIVGDNLAYKAPAFNDSGWKAVTLPHAFNEDQAFAVDIRELTDTVVWYRKHFTLPSSVRNEKVFIEFEGARQGVDLYVNGKLVGQHENGVMAFGFDLSQYVKPGKNIIAVRVDNNWDYAERTTGVKYQWSNSNFNANYGGLPKNVWLHITGKLYQTLPLYSNLGTTGVYIYATDMKIKSRSAIIHAESQVRNETAGSREVSLAVSIADANGKEVCHYQGGSQLLTSGETATLKASSLVEDLNFWSWGYGYLYTVTTCVIADGQILDKVTTRTGFRKTRFGEGKIWLNDRVLQVHGFAQRTSNEWPALGMSVPAWMSDYSNHKIIEAGGNLVRWMHVTPWQQDVESCDRVGLLQAMPAGDAEADVTGIQWEQRKSLMRDAIIYNRNNPSIIFYESGNESISREHMLEMKEIRDRYDSFGGRAIGSREMLDIREAEYGGEMLYINKSAHSPMWAMEYSRDEGHRKNRDSYSFPFHKEGEGNSMMWSASRNMMVPGNTAPYNHNQDELAAEHVRRWYDYWRERPGTGTRVSSGGVNIIFSDSNTHYRGTENYRRSGVTDPLRIEKETFYAHQVMWDGWVDVEVPHVYVVGHWNYAPDTIKPVYVVSNTEETSLFLNGQEVQGGIRENDFLTVYPAVRYEPGTLTAVSSIGGKEVARYSVSTVGEPYALRLTAIENPSGWKADGADVALVQVEVVDRNGQRCPLANNMIQFEMDGPAEWRGGMALGRPDNYILSRNLPVECGVNRVILRSHTRPGKITVRASSDQLQGASLTLSTHPFETEGGLSRYIPGDHLSSFLTRGATPLTPSYVDRILGVPVLSVTAGANTQDCARSFDDNELSEWSNDGTLNTAWITYKLEHPARIDDICVKFSGWRMRSYPLQVLAGDEIVWEGTTDRTLGYNHISIKPVLTDKITLRMKGAAAESDAFSGIVELAVPDPQEGNKAGNTNEQSFDLKIVEIEFRESLLQ